MLLKTHEHAFIDIQSDVIPSPFFLPSKGFFQYEVFRIGIIQHVLDLGDYTLKRAWWLIMAILKLF